VSEPRPIDAAPVSASELRDGDPLIERLPFAGDALEQLALLSGKDPAAFADDIAWSASVVLDGTRVFVRCDGEEWAILAPPDGPLGDAMQAARRLHALLGTRSEDWDQDR
jgi:hypothetical protein